MVASPFVARWFRISRCVIRHNANIFFDSPVHIKQLSGDVLVKTSANKADLHPIIRGDAAVLSYERFGVPQCPRELPNSLY